MFDLNVWLVGFAIGYAVGVFVTYQIIIRHIKKHNATIRERGLGRMKCN